MQEALGLQVSSTKGQKVNGREASLLAGGNEHNDGFLGRVFADGLVDWLHHGDESRGSVGDVEPLHMMGGERR